MKTSVVRLVAFTQGDAEISAVALAAAPVGHTWNHRIQVGYDEREWSAVVVYKDQDGAAVLHREWVDRRLFEQALTWYEIGSDVPLTSKED